MDMKMTAAAYAKSFDIVNNSNDNGYKNRYEEGVRDSEEANNTFSKGTSLDFSMPAIIFLANLSAIRSSGITCSTVKSYKSA